MAETGGINAVADAPKPTNRAAIAAYLTPLAALPNSTIGPMTKISGAIKDTSEEVQSGQMMSCVTTPYTLRA
jgi:hypothetical protein